MTNKSDLIFLHGGGFLYLANVYILLIHNCLVLSIVNVVHSTVCYFELPLFRFVIYLAAETTPPQWLLFQDILLAIKK